jgi:FkbM family methyltransferase
MMERLHSLLQRAQATPRFGSSPATEDDVVRVYRLLLDHDPGDAGVAYWRSLIQSKRVTVITIIDAILGSAEFKARRAARFEPTLVDCGEFHIFVRANDLFIGRAIVLTGEYEPYVARHVRAMLRPGDTFVDIGANVGYFTLLAASLVGPEGTVIAFEPSPDNCRLLRRSLAQNGLTNVRLVEKAVAEAAHAVSFSGGGADSNARILRAEEVQGREEHFAHVEALTLDEALQGQPRVDLIKMDIEGAEPRAWQGMQGVLRQHRPVIISEYAPELIRATSNCDPRQYLEQLWQEHRLSILERSGAVREVETVQQIVEAQQAAATTGVGHLDLMATPR